MQHKQTTGQALTAWETKTALLSAIEQAPLDEYRGRHWAPRPELFRDDAGYTPRHAKDES